MARGNIQQVKKLIPVSDPKAYNSATLQLAVANNNIEIVSLLLPLSEPKANNNMALLVAANKGHTEIVKLLLPVSDPKAQKSQALQHAAVNGHTEIVKLLIPVSDYLAAEQDLIDQYCDTTLLRQCIDEYEALLQKERLTEGLYNDPLFLNEKMITHCIHKRKM